MFSRLFGPAVPSLKATEVKAKIIQKPGPILLDVRRPDEYREGHISGAKLIPLPELNRRMKELPKNREIICVCRSGNRSLAATRQLLSAGYRAVNMKGGMIGWQRDGLPVKKGS